MTREVTDIYLCPKDGLMFGGTNLIKAKIQGKNTIMCPVCGKRHTIDENNQIEDKKRHGQKQNGFGCNRFNHGKKRIYT